MDGGLLMQMLPSNPLNYAMGRIPRNTKTPSDLAFTHTDCVKCADLANVVRIQFGGMARLPFDRVGSALRRAVDSVIALGAKEKMIWPEARRVVAFMQDAHAFWDWSVSYFVSSPVRKNFLLFTVTHDHYRPVSMTWYGPRPFYARTILGNRTEHLLEKFSAGNLVGHRSALHGAWCAALAALECCGAFSILPQSAGVR